MLGAQMVQGNGGETVRHVPRYHTSTAEIEGAIDALVAVEEREALVGVEERKGVSLWLVAVAAAVLIAGAGS